MHFGSRDGSGAMEKKINAAAWVAPHSSWGGSQEYIRLLANKSHIFQRKFIFCCAAHAKKYEFITSNLVILSQKSIERYDADSYFLRVLGAFSIAWQIRATFTKNSFFNEFDLLLHSNGSPLLCFFLALLLPSRSTNCVTTFHDFGSIRSNKVRFALNSTLFLITFILSGRKILEIIFPSNHIQSQFCNDVTKKWSFFNMSVINTGIVLPTVLSRGESSLEPTYRYGMIGRVAEAKAPFTWIEGAASYLQDGGTGKFCWIGGGPLLEECRARVVKSGLQNKIFFLGYVEDLLGDAYSFNTLVFSSAWEGGCLPRGVSEQLAIGKAAILPSLPSIRESFEQAGCLHLVDFYSSADSASLALAIIRHEERSESSTLDIRTFVAKYHSFTIELSKTEAIYSKLNNRFYSQHNFI
jgi:glycosyltransferase involved in cell wall biosynthesis